MTVLPSPARLPRVSRRVAVLAGGGVLAAAVGAGALWTSSATTVALSVDGVSRSVTLHGHTVADVLRREHLTAGQHDVLAPSAGSRVSDGSRVSLRRGRQLTLVVDGVSRSVWVTADDVDEALQQVGLRADGAALSASRSRAIGLDGLSLEVRLPKLTGVTVDGRTTTRTTTAATVGDLLAEEGVVLRPQDVTSLPATTPVTDRLTVAVVRHDTRQVVEDGAVPFATVRTPDPGALTGTERVTAPGRPGAQRRTFDVALTDGVETGRTLVGTVVTTAPVAQQVAVGTKARPVPAPAPPAPVRAPVAGPAPSGGLDWAGLARCESGGNPRAVGGGGLYYGLYQFSLGTWRGVGGSGSPADASPAEQTSRAQLLYNRTGRSSWPVCGRYL